MYDRDKLKAYEATGLTPDEILWYVKTQGEFSTRKEIEYQLKYEDMKSKYEKLLKDFIYELREGTDDICLYCKHEIKCAGEDCSKYLSGNGMYDKFGKFIDWKWDCMEFDYGTCPMMESAPCSHCVKNEFSDFEYEEKVCDSIV